VSTFSLNLLILIKLSFLSRKFSDFHKNKKNQSEETKPPEVTFVNPRNSIPGRSNSHSFKRSIKGIFTKYLKFLKQSLEYMI